MFLSPRIQIEEYSWLIEKNPMVTNVVYYRKEWLIGGPAKSPAKLLHPQDRGFGRA
jgi:hypothetical protein